MSRVTHWSYKPDRVRSEDRGYVTPCRIWQLGKDRDGYGLMRIGSRTDGSRRSVRVHRHAWEEAHGPIPAGRLPNHLCQQRDCLNVEHMELVTVAGNIRRNHAGTRLTSEVAAMVRAATGTPAEVARRFGLPYESTRRIMRGERWNIDKAEV